MRCDFFSSIACIIRAMANANIEAIRTALNDLANDQLTGLPKSMILSDISVYCNSREAVEALSSTTISSYSIAGRSVTKRDIASLNAAMTVAWQRIESMLDGIPSVTTNCVISLDHTKGGTYEGF